jgi:MFS family permease
MVVAFLIGAVTFVSVTYMPFVLQMMGLNTATTIGMALTVQSVATAVAAGIFGPLRRYASYNMTCFLCFLAGAVGLAVCSTAATFPASIVGLLLLGLCMGWAPPNFVSRAAEIARPETRGRIVGVMKGMYFSASLLAVLALEPVVRSQGPKGALIAIMIVCLVAAAVFLPLALPSLRRSRRA